MYVISTVKVDLISNYLLLMQSDQNTFVSTVKMSLLLKLLLVSFTLIIFCKQVNCESKLKVHLLYESLCPDSIKFIKEQLYPVWKQFSQYIDITFVPFGKSVSLENGRQFVCQHGPKECLGNRIQSCALSALQDQNAQVEYVHCFMNIFKKHKHDAQQLGQQCAANVNVDWNYISQCHDSSEGTNLQLLAEEITAQIKPKFVPTVLFNEQFHQQAQDDSQTNFYGVVCSLIKNIHPHAC